MSDNKPALVVLAAGMGSRYGGLKQIDPVGPAGATLLDYSIFDAVRAGFRDHQVGFVAAEGNAVGELQSAEQHLHPHPRALGIIEQEATVAPVVHDVEPARLQGVTHLGGGVLGGGVGEEDAAVARHGEVVCKANGRAFSRSG